MRFTEIYNKNIDKWPEKIAISDGYLTSNKGFFFPSLSKIHEQVEDNVGIGNSWDQLMIWTMFQVFHSESQLLLKAGKHEINTKLIDKSKIENKYFLNLSTTEGWEEEC